MGLSAARPWAFSFVIRLLRGWPVAPARYLEERKAAGMAAGCWGSSVPLGGFVTFPGAGRLHAPQVPLARCAVFHDGPGIVGAHQAACSLLHSPWRLPGLVDVLGGEILEDGEVFSTARGSKPPGRPPPHLAWLWLSRLPNVRPVPVRLLAEGDGRVDVEISVEEGAARQPQPVAGVEGPVGVQQELLKDLRDTVVAWGRGPREPGRCRWVLREIS